MECIFPGSFDLFHDGHLLILNKSLKIFSQVYIVVANNCSKKHHYSLKERKKYIESKIKDYENVKVIICTEKYMADLAKKMNIVYYVRGIRNIKDYIYEKKLWKIYQKRNKNLELILLPTNKTHKKISSRLINKTQSY